MSGNFDQFGDSLAKTQEDYIKAADSAKEFQTFQEQIKATMVALSKTEGFSDLVMSGITGFLKFMQWVAENGTLVISILAAFKAAQLGLAVAQVALGLSAAFAKKDMMGKCGKIAMGIGGVGLVGALVAVGFIIAKMAWGSPHVYPHDPSPC